MMCDVDVTTLPTLVEVSWSEAESACVMNGEHCWHVQLVTSVGTAHLVGAARCCCWCGLHQTAHRETDLDHKHGPLRPAELSQLDLLIEYQSGRG